MALRQNRNDIVLATKYSNMERGADRIVHSNYAGNGIRSMKLSLEESLKRLQTTYVDILYVHFSDFTASVEVRHSRNDHAAAVKVLYLDISDAPAWVVTKASQYTCMAGLRPFVIYKGTWNSSPREFVRDLVPMCQIEGMGIAPYGVLSQGRFQTEEIFFRSAGRTTLAVIISLCLNMITGVAKLWRSWHLGKG